MTTQVLIIGKGIAGLVLSFLLSKRNIDHVLVGRWEKVSPLALGETLPPSALPLLQSLGLLPVFVEHSLRKTTGYHSCWGSDRVVDHNFYFNRPFQHGLKLNKVGLLGALEQLQQSYITEYNRTLSLSCDDGVKVTLDGDIHINAQLVVDATGRKRQVCKSRGILNHEYDNLMAFSSHLSAVKLPRLPHGVYVESFENGWGIVSVLSESHNVMTLFTHKSMATTFSDFSNWKELLTHTQHLKDYLNNNTNPKVIGANANTSRPRQCSGDHWLAIGDAAMAFDPLSSHGITSAVYTASQAAVAIENRLTDNNSPAFREYESQLNKIFSGYLEQKLQRYQQEVRWKDTAFWKEM